MNSEEEITILLHKIHLKEEELSKLKNQLSLLIFKEIQSLKEKNGKKE